MSTSNDPASLQNLVDIVVPPPVPWWPLAPGWYWLAAFIVLGMAWLLWRVFCRYRADAYRRAALAEFAGLTDLTVLPELLKRTALAVFPRERVAALSGPDWWAFLDQTNDGNAFSNTAGPLLDRMAYDPETPLDTAERECVLNAAEGWLRRHRSNVGESPC
ncbi:MAG: DUF4381 domain-containing protein [Candidatus Competibacteraceae bacterium]|nr:DUF4381 domain-containing protein [Candidatus Competibacteraceae bacterium]